jgi:hypothetical protein
VKSEVELDAAKKVATAEKEIGRVKLAREADALVVRSLLQAVRNKLALLKRQMKKKNEASAKQ